MTLKQLFVSGLAILLLALGTRWFLNNFELKEIEVPAPLKGEARSNDLLAARLFLNEMGLPARRINLLKRLKALPSTEDVLLLDSDLQTIDATRGRALLEWVAQGGHLIIRPVPPWYSDDTDEPPIRSPVFDALKISAEHPEEPEYPEDANHAYPATSPEGGATRLHILFDATRLLSGANPDDHVWRDINGVHMINRALGEGQVTVLGEMDFLHNDEIAIQDHAQALWHIVQARGGQPRTVWLINKEGMPPLWLLAWRHARPLVVISLILLVAWLIAAGHRFGPPLPRPAVARRRIMEHIEAAGRFWWREGEQLRLIHCVRNALQHRLARVHPGWRALTLTEREAHLAGLTGQPAGRIRELLHDETPRSRDAFIRCTAELERIRKTL